MGSIKIPVNFGATGRVMTFPHASSSFLLTIEVSSHLRPFLPSSSFHSQANPPLSSSSPIQHASTEKKAAKMGIKQLFQIIKEEAPDAIKEGEIKNQFGRKVAIVSRHPVLQAW